MAASKVSQEIAVDETVCGICGDVVADRRRLPCIHAFCLECLKRVWEEKHPGDCVPCPSCGMEFNIPAGGIYSLPKNISKDTVAKQLSNTEKWCTCHICSSKCDICASLRIEQFAMLLPAVSFCVECQQKLCLKCAKVHKIFSSSKLHMVLPIKELQNISEKQCEKHTEDLSFYCLDCEITGCSMCFFEIHVGHRCIDIDDDVAEKLKNQLKICVEETEKLVLEVDKKSGNLEIMLKDCDDQTNKDEEIIRQRGEEMKRMVDRQVDSLLQGLKAGKDKRVKVINIAKGQLIAEKQSLENFVKYSQQIIENNNIALADVIVRAMALIARANTLKSSRNNQIEEPLEFLEVPSVPDNIVSCFL